MSLERRSYHMYTSAHDICTSNPIHLKTPISPSLLPENPHLKPSHASNRPQPRQDPSWIPWTPTMWTASCGKQKSSHACPIRRNSAHIREGKIIHLRYSIRDTTTSVVADSNIQTTRYYPIPIGGIAPRTISHFSLGPIQKDKEFTASQASF